jgi:hypothetical protein
MLTNQVNDGRGSMRSVAGKVSLEAIAAKHRPAFSPS